MPELVAGVKKINVLAWGDYCCYTGFANVMSNILRRLTSFASIDVVGVNYDGSPDYDRKRFPGRIWPARSFVQGPHDDMWGRQKLINLLRENDYDVLFMLQDTFVADKMLPFILEVRKKFNKKYKIVYYYPMDTEPLSHWVKDSVALVDVPVAYSEFGYKCSVSAVPELEKKLKVIPHGINPYEFYPIKNRDEVKEVRDVLTGGAARDKFLLVNVNRNTPRKDIPRSLMILSALKESGLDVAMYLHMSNRDLGGDLTPVGVKLNLWEGKDYFLPGDLDAIRGYSLEMLNYIYNMADAVITTSLGEGWGFSLTEAMATRTPVVGPNHSSIKEILGEGRGILVEAGNNNSLWRVADAPDNMVLRPLVDVDDMARKISHLMQYGDHERYQKMVDGAYEWVCKLNWDDLVKERWLPLFL